MRGALSGLAALLAALLLPLVITSVWTTDRVTDTDGYVAAVGPLADDPEVQQALSERLEQYAADVVRLNRLDPARRQAARLVIRTAVTAVVTSPAFRPTWEAANRAGHAELLRSLRSDRAGEVTPLDLAVVVDSVLDALRAQGLPIRDVAPPALEFTPDRAQVRAAQEAYQALDAAQRWLPLAWVLLVGLTLLVAQRRMRALAVLAGASLASVALLWPILGAVRSGVVAAVPSTDRDLAAAIWDGVTSSLDRSVLIAVIVSAIALVVASVLGVLGVVRGGRPQRSG